jgi:thiamine pyrophosphokinase
MRMSSYLAKVQDPMRTIIIANGERPTQDAIQYWLRPDDRIVCADGGAQHALALGLRPDVVIGDLDSLDEPAQVQLAALGARFVVHPTAKDETDLELALLLAAQEGATEIVVLGGFGGRLDQTVANVLLLTLPQLAGVSVRIADGEQEAFIIHNTTTIQGQLGDTLSLIPLGGDVEGVITTGLLYPLRDETLRFGPAHGVSNVFTATVAQVTVRRGMLLAIHSRKTRLYRNQGMSRQGR